MGCDPRRLSSIRTRRGETPRARASCKFVSSRLLAAIALFIASTISTNAQTDWTGAVSSDWFTAGNWNAGVPTVATSANVDTVTPNSTLVAIPGATALNLSVGQTGTGVLTIQNGGTLTDVGGFVGNLPGSQGTTIVSGAGSTWTNIGTVVVGGQGTGALTVQNGGTVNSGGGGSVGLAVGSTGTVTVTGVGSTWNNSPGGGLNIGSFGTGTLTIANGGMVINNTAFTANIGQGPGSLGTVLVTGAGSTWSNSSGVNIGNLGTGTLTIADGGTVTAPAVVIATNAGAVGTLNIGAGAGNPATAPGTLNAPSVAFGAGTGTLNFNHTSASYVFAPAISGNGTVNVFAGTTTLTAANSYSGATNVNAGTLRAGALNTFSPNSAVTVANGGTLDLNGFSQTVASLSNAGLVNMGTGTPPGTVLTTTSYVGTGGTIAMNTFLAGDGSPSDRLLHQRRHSQRQLIASDYQRRRRRRTHHRQRHFGSRYGQWRDHGARCFRAGRASGGGGVRIHAVPLQHRRKQSPGLVSALDLELRADPHPAAMPNAHDTIATGDHATIAVDPEFQGRNFALCGDSIDGAVVRTQFARHAA